MTDHATAGHRRSILDLPFNRELATGTLDRERFRFYVVQDALYLAQYSRALSTASARSPEVGAAVAFGQAAHGVIVVECALHEDFFARFGVDPQDAARAETATEATGAAMLEAFKRSTLYEWMFWDRAYRIERWPAAV